MQKPDNPAAMWAEAQAAHATFLTLEKAAIKAALVAAHGNLAQAGVVLGVSVGVVTRATWVGGRHEDLRPLLTRKVGHPPVRLEAIAKAAQRLPDALKGALKAPMNPHNAARKSKRKPRVKPAPKVHVAPRKYTAEEKHAFVVAWRDASKTAGTLQDAFCKRAKIASSSLREWCKTFADASSAPQAPTKAAPDSKPTGYEWINE